MQRLTEVTRSPNLESMASPLVSDGRALNPREKAHFTVQLGDRITATQDNEREGSGFRSVRYNHKPPLNHSTRKTSLAPSSATNNYTLTLSDQDSQGKNNDIFTFVGQKTQLPRKTSYVLLFDPAGQKATLEPLDETFTFNLSKKNGVDVEGEYTKIYPKKQSKDATAGVPGSQDTTTSGVADELFGDEIGRNGHGTQGLDREDPDPENPYDFRHFLSATQNTIEGSQSKRGDESEYGSPDYRTGTASAKVTPVMPAKKAVTAAAKQAATGRKRKEPEADALVGRKTKSTATASKGDKKSQQSTTATNTPRVRLDRRSSTNPKAETKPQGSRKGAGASSGKVIKSAEIVHSSDEDSDEDMHIDSNTHRKPASPLHSHHHETSDRDAEGFSDDDGDFSMGGGLEIEVPDARPNTRRPNALSSLGLGLGGLGHLRSPSAGPISLASAANSVEGSPRGSQRGRHVEEVIEFGNIGGGGSDEEEEVVDDEEAEGEEDADGAWEDRDVEPMDLGPPAQEQQNERATASVPEAAAVPVEEDEDDPLYKEMMEGLAGDSSEESEEE